MQSGPKLLIALITAASSTMFRLSFSAFAGRINPTPLRRDQSGNSIRSECFLSRSCSSARTFPSQ
jgi:hypothetical protein